MIHDEIVFSEELYDDIKVIGEHITHWELERGKLILLLEKMCDTAWPRPFRGLKLTGGLTGDLTGGLTGGLTGTLESTSQGNSPRGERSNVGHLSAGHPPSSTPPRHHSPSTTPRQEEGETETGLQSTDNLTERPSTHPSPSTLPITRATTEDHENLLTLARDYKKKGNILYSYDIYQQAAYLGCPIAIYQLGRLTKLGMTREVMTLGGGGGNAFVNAYQYFLSAAQLGMWNG